VSILDNWLRRIIDQDAEQQRADAQPPLVAPYQDSQTEPAAPPPAPVVLDSYTPPPSAPRPDPLDTDYPPGYQAPEGYRVTPSQVEPPPINPDNTTSEGLRRIDAPTGTFPFRPRDGDPTNPGNIGDHWNDDLKNQMQRQPLASDDEPVNRALDLLQTTRGQDAREAAGGSSLDRLMGQVAGTSPDSSRRGAYDERPPREPLPPWPPVSAPGQPYDTGDVMHPAPSYPVDTRPPGAQPGDVTDNEGVDRSLDPLLPPYQDHPPYVTNPFAVPPDTMLRQPLGPATAGPDTTPTSAASTGPSFQDDYSNAGQTPSRPQPGTLVPIQNPDGSVSTELSITVTDPELNAGRPTNIPSIWGGRRVSEDEAIDNAITSGYQFPSFDTLDDAETAARARSADLGAGRATSIGGATVPSPALPPSGQAPGAQPNETPPAGFAESRGSDDPVDRALTLLQQPHETPPAGFAESRGSDTAPDATARSRPLEDATWDAMFQPLQGPPNPEQQAQDTWMQAQGVNPHPAPGGFQAEYQRAGQARLAQLGKGIYDAVGAAVDVVGDADIRQQFDDRRAWWQDLIAQHPEWQQGHNWLDPQTWHDPGAYGSLVGTAVPDILSFMAGGTVARGVLGAEAAEAPLIEIGGRTLETVGSGAAWATGVFLPSVGAEATALKDQGFSSAEALAGGIVLGAGETALSMAVMHAGNYAIAGTAKGLMAVPAFVQRQIERRQPLDVAAVNPDQPTMTRADVRAAFNQAARGTLPVDSVEAGRGVLDATETVVSHLQNTGQIRDAAAFQLRLAALRAYAGRAAELIDEPEQKQAMQSLFQQAHDWLRSTGKLDLRPGMPSVEGAATEAAGAEATSRATARPIAALPPGPEAAPAGTTQQNAVPPGWESAGGGPGTAEQAARAALETGQRQATGAAIGAATGAVTGATTGDDDQTWDQRLNRALMGAAIGGVAGGTLAAHANLGAARLIDSLIARGALDPNILTHHPDAVTRVKALFGLAAEGLPDEAEVAVPGMARYLQRVEPQALGDAAPLLDGPVTAGQVRALVTQTPLARIKTAVSDLVADAVTGLGNRAGRAAELRADAATVSGIPAALQRVADTRWEYPGQHLPTALGRAVEITNPDITSFVKGVAQDLGVQAPRVFLADTSHVNAGVMQGPLLAPIMVLTRGLANAGLTEPEMRALLTHELAHAAEGTAAAAREQGFTSTQRATEGGDLFGTGEGEQPAVSTFKAIPRPGGKGFAVMRTDPDGKVSLASTHVNKSEAEQRADFENRQAGFKPTDRGRSGGEPQGDVAPEDLLGGYARTGQGNEQPDLFGGASPPGRTAQAAARVDEQAAEGPSTAGRTYDYSSTQLDLPAEVADKVTALGKRIPDSALAEHGRESTPHVTVKYGLETADPEAVREIVERHGPITLTLGRTSLFAANRQAGGEPGAFDVVKVDVTSPALRELNAELAKLPNGDTHPTYQPHVTVAYVKPGEGQKYAGSKALAGQTVTIDRLTFSGKDGQQVEIPLKGTSAEPLAPGSQVNVPVRLGNEPTMVAGRVPPRMQAKLDQGGTGVLVRTSDAGHWSATGGPMSADEAQTAVQMVNETGRWPNSRERQERMVAEGATTPNASIPDTGRAPAAPTPSAAAPTFERGTAAVYRTNKGKAIDATVVGDVPGNPNKTRVRFANGKEMDVPATQVTAKTPRQVKPSRAEMNPKQQEQEVLPSSGGEAAAPTLEDMPRRNPERERAAGQTDLFGERPPASPAAGADWGAFDDDTLREMLPVSDAASAREIRQTLAQRGANVERPDTEQEIDERILTHLR
jgi:2'-5' RNA ligase